MHARFLHPVFPAPQRLQFADGVLYAFGYANLAWKDVARILGEGRFPNEIRGNFAFVWEGKELVAAVDHVATYPLFYTGEYISNVYSELLAATPHASENTKVGFQIRFLGGQSFGEETAFHPLRRILPGCRLFKGRHSAYMNLLDYPGDEKADLGYFRELVEKAVSGMAKERNALLLSGGTDSVTLAAVVKKLGLEDRFSFVHAYSRSQPLTERHLVGSIAREMGLRVNEAQVEFSGDVIPSQRARQYSFWVENPFLAKRLAVESAGLADCRIFTGELGDQLFGGPKNAPLLNYALQAKNISAEEVAMIWVNLSASYGRNSGFRPFGKIELAFQESPEAQLAYEELVADIAAAFSRMRSRDFLNRIMLLNYLVKGPYRTWAYSQDELDWAHPFASWELFDYAFRLLSEEKISEGGKSKAILLKAWKSHVSEIPWRKPKHGFGIPARSKLRIEA